MRIEFSREFLSHSTALPADRNAGTEPGISNHRLRITGKMEIRRAVRFARRVYTDFGKGGRNHSVRIPNYRIGVPVCFQKMHQRPIRICQFDLSANCRPGILRTNRIHDQAFWNQSSSDRFGNYGTGCQCRLPDCSNHSDSSGRNGSPHDDRRLWFGLLQPQPAERIAS